MTETNKSKFISNLAEYDEHEIESENEEHDSLNDIEENEYYYNINTVNICKLKLLAFVENKSLKLLEYLSDKDMEDFVEDIIL